MELSYQFRILMILAILNFKKTVGVNQANCSTIPIPKVVANKLYVKSLFVNTLPLKDV